MWDIPETRFPLFRLPDNAIVKVLKDVRHIEQIALSLFSTRAKHFIKRLTPRPSGIHFHINTVIQMTIEYENDLRTFSFMWHHHIHHHISKTVVMRKRDNRERWQAIELAPREWMSHLFDVLSYEKIDTLNFYDAGNRCYDLNFLSDLFQGYPVTKLWLRQYCTPEYCRNILNIFNESKELHVGCQHLDDMETTLLENFDYLNFEGPSITSLDQLLLLNSTYFTERGCQLSDKNLNRFVKLWQKGSNPRLEYLQFRILFRRRYINKDVLLRGLTYFIVPDSEERHFRSSSVLTERIRGGYDIIRATDGTKATILVEDNDKVFKFLIWP